MMGPVYICSMARTPFGSFLGSLSSLTAPELGSIAIQEAIARAELPTERVDEVFMGCVLAAGQGQAPARQAALGAGLPHSIPCTTVNKVCGSGMKSIICGLQTILLGEGKVVVTGGMESMSKAPYLLPKARQGARLGHAQMLDSLIFDGLWDPYGDQHMGNCAELCAAEKGYTREQQDAYAKESFTRAREADISDQLVAVEVKERKKTFTVDKDEGPYKADLEKLSSLRPAFEPKGTVTAANASSINDGACALVLASQDVAQAPLAKIVGFAHHAQEPKWFTTAPIFAVEKLLEKMGWTVDDVDLFEINEAFAVVALACRDQLKIPQAQFNVLGGAIAIGHPIGASGTRIVMNLISALKQKRLKRGVAAICIGGGEATALAIELV